MAFIPNLDCTVAKRLSDEPDENGQFSYGSSSDQRCAIVKLNRAREKTSVRSDTSASRGNAAEYVADARLLFLTDVDVAVGDLVEVSSVTIRVTAVMPRYAVTGEYDHNQVEGDLWE